MKRFFLFLLTLALVTACSPAVPRTAPASAPALTPGAAAKPPTATSRPVQPATAAAPAAVIDPQTVSRLKETGAFSIANPYRLYFSPDGRRAYVESLKLIERFSLPGLRAEKQFAIAEADALLAVSPTRDLAAIRKDTATIELFSIETGQSVGAFQPQGQFAAAFFTPDGAALGVVSLDEIRVDLYDAQSGKLLRQFRGFQTAAPVFNVFPIPDGRSLAWVSRARLQLMDFASGQLGPEFSHEDFIAGWALSPDDALLATSAGGEVNGEFFPLIFLWDKRSGQQVDRIKLPESPSPSLAFSPDGQLLAAAVGKTVQLYRVSDRALLVTLTGPAENVSYLAFAPDGASLLASAQDGAVHVWQVVP